MDPLEWFWDRLLSRSPEQIRAVYRTIDEESQREVLAHLKKMASEEGWHPDQVASARAALEALAEYQKPTP